MQQARLVPLDGGDPVELTRDVMIVGRKDDCDLHIDHKSISKQHCVLAVSDGLVFVRDLGSTNGTRVNGQRIRRAAMVPNDVVSFAARKFQYVIGDASAANSQTQAMEADEIAEYVKAADAPDADTPVPVPPKVEVRTNDLPDVYPDEPAKS